MHSHFSSILLDLPELNIGHIQKEKDEIFIQAEPVEYTQPCPICSSVQTIRRGVAYKRKIRHLSAFGRRVFLHLPAIRLSCGECHSSFVWQYECVSPKKRYTKSFEASLLGHVVGSTVTHTAKVTVTPATTVERVFKSWMEKESCRIQTDCIQKAQNSQQLILGIDDFAIRKGHTYNTGLHDLRGSTFLDVISGRTLEELRSHYQFHPELATLQPKAVVMDLAKGYHAFIKEVYPTAIRIADRFHVNRYIMEALQLVRKQVQKTLSPFARMQLKQNHRLLGKRYDQLSSQEKQGLKVLLRYSKTLRDVYKWKEAWIEWYDCSSTYTHAQQGFTRCLDQGKRIHHVAVQDCLKTLMNWREEICNYHRFRFTNAAVEGKNNKIKALQRRHYFTRNPQYYKQRILLECNEELIRS